MAVAAQFGLTAVYPPEVPDVEARVAALTPGDLAVLGAIYLHHPSTRTAVASRLGWTPATVAERLAVLEAAGLVTREPTDWPDA